MGDTLASVLAAPMDNQPRRAHAEAIAGGDPQRAEFIQVQVELDELNPMHPGQAARRRPLKTKERLSFLQNEYTWRDADMPRFADSGRVEYVRGWPDRIWSDGKKLIEGGDDLFARCPVLQLQIEYVTEVWDDLIELDCLTKITALDIRKEYLDDDHLRGIINSPMMQNLTMLKLKHNDFSKEGVMDLIEAKPPNLQYLSLRGNPFQPGWNRGAEPSQNQDLKDLLTELDVVEIPYFRYYAGDPDPLSKPWRDFVQGGDIQPVHDSVAPGMARAD